MDAAGIVEAIERDRLRCLVAGDVEAASRLHAHDFQLITPSGQTVSGDEYMRLIGSGELVYVVWEPADVVVRMYGDAAVLRYEADIHVSLGGELLPRTRLWHTDVYEQRDGRWQIVWSQATEIRSTLSV